VVTKGKIQIEITAKDDASKQMAKIGKSAEAMGKKFKAMGKIMVGVGLAMAAALGAAVVSYAKAGDEVHKMALRTGFATEALSELRHVAMLSGTDLSSIEKATKKMSKSLLDATRGLETYTRSFEELGLDIKALEAMSPEEQFWAIASALADVDDQFRKVGLAQDIFGRAGTALLPMLAAGSEAIAEQRQEAHDLGIVFDDVASEKAAALTDAMGTLKESLQGVMFAVAEELVPVITEFLENKVIPAIQKVMEWVKANEDLSLTLAKVAGVLMVGGALMLGLGMVAKAIIAINSALIVMHALMGPAGWLKLAAGLAVAGAAIWGMTELMKPPEMQKGGIVPGPIGAPIPIIAHGGEQFAGVGKSFGGTNIYIGNFMGDESSLRAFSRKVKEVIGQDVRRTSFSGINKSEYFPGSSAP